MHHLHEMAQRQKVKAYISHSRKNEPMATISEGVFTNREIHVVHT
jgi:hypothetical protein